MGNDYKLIFSGRNLYNEVDVPGEMNSVGIGTMAGCVARFNKKSFKQDFLLILTKTAMGWHARGEWGVYFEKAGKQIYEIDIAKGEFVTVISQKNAKEIFKFSCVLNYDNEPKVYDARVDLRGKKVITVGNAFTNNIVLADIADDELIKLENEDNYLRLSVMKTELGVFVNGSRTIGATKIKNKDFFSCGQYGFFYNEGYLYFSNSDRVVLQEVNCEKVLESGSSLEYPKFNRNTRVRNVLNEDAISILDPPDVPKEPKEKLLMTLLPSIVMLVLVVVFRGIMSSNMGAYVILSVCTMSLGIVTTIINYRKTKKEYTASVEERTRIYEEYIARKTNEIQKARQKEVSDLEEMYPDTSETNNRIISFSGKLFDRTLRDEDFLHIRIGAGSRKSIRKVTYKKKESLLLGDDLQNTPEKLAEEYESVHRAPIVVDLKKAGILGVIGTERDCDEFLKVIIEDICSRQFFKEAMMFAICNKEQADSHEWLRFLPHFQKESGLVRNIACDDESCELQYEFLFKNLSHRESLGKDVKHSAIIVFVLDQMGLYSHPVSHYLKNAKELGVYFVFLARTTEELPLYCGNLVTLSGSNCGVLIESANKTIVHNFMYHSISDEQMWQIALKLAPVYCEDVSVEGNLPSSFSLFNLLGIQGADDLDFNERWKSADITKSMAAPLGLKSGEEIVSLDLHEKAHGPHGLVAGTTGSGKSEIIQTYILSMATLYHPYEVGFVIIDFKGGGMANLFADLPHLMGAITDIDGKAINRSLMSIRAEIDKRKRWFAEADVNNITGYIRKYKAGEISKDKPLPHLILIIDEFAELKADQPEFMKEVISAARVGRSLGIHLILATQKPAGVIDEQIWSNSRFKLCLKVQSKSDSNEVLKSPLAAEIREPGRAYLKVGNDEIFELFQSAYSGGAAQSEEIEHITPFKLFEVDGCGRRKLIYEKKKSKEQAKAETQLGAIVRKISQYCEQVSLPKLENICLPPLSSNIEFPSDVEITNNVNNSLSVNVGICDDPSTQSQNEVEIDVLSDNLLVIGSAQSGKSNLLMTLIRGLATKYTPDDVNMYIMDFGPSIIGNYRELPHVGGVVTDGEDEKLKNLFKLLNTEIAIRKKKIMNANVSSLAAYREAGYRDLPMIVVFVDNFTALRELYFANEDYLLPICRNGLTVGISVVMANQNMQGIGFRYLSTFSKRIALHCNDTNDYATVIEHCKIHPSDTPGRGVMDIDKTVYELQVYSAFAGETEKDKVEEQLAFVEQSKELAGSMLAKKIPMVPEDLTSRLIDVEFNVKKTSPYDVNVGVSYDSIEAITIDVATVGAIGIAGKATNESRTFFDNVFGQLTSNAKNSNVEFYFIDSLKHDYAQYKDSEFTQLYTSDANAFVEVVNQIYGHAKSRFELCLQNGYEYLESAAQKVIVVNGNEAINVLCKNATAVSSYKEIQDMYGDMKICFIYMNIDNAEVSYSGPEILKRLKESRQVFFFDTLSKFKFLQVPQAVVRQEGRHQSNDGYYFAETEAERIRVAKYIE